MVNDTQKDAATANRSGDLATIPNFGLSAGGAGAKEPIAGSRFARWGALKLGRAARERGPGADSEDVWNWVKLIIGNIVSGGVRVER